jgi:tRNA threonylcarbamoyl adenosine modification protein YjeE
LNSIEINTLEDLKIFATEFVNQHPEGAVVGLSGELGAGKTAFVKEVIRVIAKDSNIVVPSPSFTIHQSYGFLSPPVEHYDFYRMEEPSIKDLVEIGYFEQLQNTLKLNGFIFIEWAEYFQPTTMLQLSLHLKFELEDNKRRISTIM